MPGPATPPLLRVQSLRKNYGAFQAVEDCHFQIAPGEILGLLGRNGSGKSTLIKMLSGLVLPSGGEAWLEERSLLGRQGVRARRRMGAVIEAPAFYPQLSGRRNLQLLAALRRCPASEARIMLERVGLGEHADRLYGRFSMGMKQRLGLAAAFMHRPRLVLLDEPTNGLDPMGQEQISGLIRELARAGGASVLLCSHQLAEVGALANRALVIEQGRLVHEAHLDQPQGMPGLEGVIKTLAASTGREA